MGVFEMTRTISICVGPVAVLIECPEQYARVFADNFYGTKSVSSVKVPDLHLIVLARQQTQKFDAEFDSGKNFQFKNGCFRFCGPQFIALVDGMFASDRPCRVEVMAANFSGMGKIVKLVTRAVFASFKQRRVVIPRQTHHFPLSVMSYSLFWFVMHGVLLKKQSSFIHASALERNGRVMLLAGTGGCGKTSMTFRMLEDDKFSYLAEDFSILSADGDVFFNPKTLSIYASDLRGDPQLLVKYAKRHLTGAERRAWFRCRDGRGSNPMRKVPPVHVLGEDRLCHKAPLGVAFFLVRGNFDSINVQDLDSHDFVERSMNASYRELKTLSEIVAQGHAVGSKEVGLPTIEEFRAGFRGIYEKAIVECPCYLLRIPRQVDPCDVSTFLAGRCWW